MSDPLVPLGRDIFSRDIFLISLHSWDVDWAGILTVPSQHFCLLIVGDARDVSNDVLGRLAVAALDRGCVYACAWGPDCVRVETCFDSACAEMESANHNPVVLTVSHPEETLDEALEYVTEVAFPDSAFAETCRSTLIVVVGNTDWARWIQGRFQK